MTEQKQRRQGRHESKVSVSLLIKLLREGVVKPTAVTVDGQQCKTVEEAIRALKEAPLTGSEQLIP